MINEKTRLLGLTLGMDQTLLRTAMSNEKMISFGHLGTHFELMVRFCKVKLPSDGWLIYPVKFSGLWDCRG